MADFKVIFSAGMHVIKKKLTEKYAFNRIDFDIVPRLTSRDL